MRTATRRTSLLLAALALLATAAVWTATAARAAAITVNDGGDGAPADDGRCTLREAVTAANTNTSLFTTMGECAAGEMGMDTITFMGVDAVTLTQGQLPPITEALRIDGASGAGGEVVITAATGSRILEQDAGPVELANLELTGGSAPSGGAILLDVGALDLDSVDVVGNQATGLLATTGGGGIFSGAGTTLTIANSSTIIGNGANAVDQTLTGAGSGGGIHTRAGTLTIGAGVVIDANTARRAGAGIEGAANPTISLTGVILTGNVTGPAPGNGGGLHITGPGTVTVTAVTATDNIASNEGGALWNETGTMTVSGGTYTDNVAQGAAAGSGGGALFNNGGTLTVAGATFTGNDATGAAPGGSGGAILNDALMDNDAAMPATGNGVGTLSVTDSTFTSNTAVRAGGGIEGFDGTNGTTNIAVAGSDFDGSTAGINGGAIHITGPGDTTVTGGSADTGSAQEGGGFWNELGTMTVDGTTFTDNVATGGAAGQGGGALFNNGGALVVQDAVFTGNDATGAAPGGSGGAILNDARMDDDTVTPNVAGGGGTLSVTDSTFTSNTAVRAGGGIEGFDGTNGTTNIAVAGSDFDGSTAGINGGAIHITGPGDTTVTGGSADTGSAQEGGGFWNELGTMTVDGTTFTDNVATGGAAGQGGGALFNNGGALVVQDAVFTGNDATGAAPGGSGGAILNDALMDGSPMNPDVSAPGGLGTVAVTDSTFDGNTAVRAGGAIEGFDGTNGSVNVSVAGSDFDDNTAQVNGGAIHLTGEGDTTVEGGSASGNVAGQEGGGFWNELGRMTVRGVVLDANRADGADPTQGGGGLFNNGGVLRVEGSSLTSNVVVPPGTGGAVLCDGGALSLGSTTIAGNTQPQIAAIDGCAIAVDGSGDGSPTPNPTPTPTPMPTDPDDEGGDDVDREDLDDLEDGDVIDVEQDDVVDVAIAVSRQRFATADDPDEQQGTDRAGFQQAGGEPTGGTADHVLLARDDLFADTLAASSLTGDGPLLLTDSDVLDAATGEEIDRVLGDSGVVYLLGGVDAISEDIASALDDAGHDVRRVAGETRVETSVLLATLTRALGGSAEVVIARATAPGPDLTAEWADSITGGAWAADTMTPVVLTPTDELHPAVRTWLEENRPTRSVVLGGEAAIAGSVVDELPAPERFAGPNRYATAAAIATGLWGQPVAGYLVTAGDAPDGWATGLAAGGLGADLDSPLVLVERDRLPQETDAVIACGDDGLRPPLVVVQADGQIGQAVMDRLAAC